MFPNEHAAEIAVRTVKKYYEDTGSRMKAVFNVFKDEDLLFIGHYCIINKIHNFFRIKNPGNIKITDIGQVFHKADDGTRTRDLLTTNEVRYHLCHISLSIVSTNDSILYDNRSCQ